MRRITTAYFAVAAVLAAIAAGPAMAASDDAWEAFRADVAEKCLSAANELFVEATATVDPVGSEHYGLALVSGPARGEEDAAIRAICVYDKATKEVEIGGELPGE